MILKRRVGPVRALRNQLYRFRHKSVVPILWRTLVRHNGVLPAFLVIGAERGGSTSMFKYLSRNPALSPSLVKEPHYFDQNYARGLAWYKAHFDAASSATPDRPVISFEASPYLYLPHTERRAAALLPDARLVVLLRNPIDRAYSFYQLMVRFGRETRSFEQAIAEEPAMLAEELPRMQAAEPVWSKRVILGAYIAKGIYIDQLLRWEGCFPRENFLVLRSEDFFADPDQALRQVADFVGFPHHGLSEYKAFLSTRSTPINPDTRRELVAYYREHNARLYEHLGRDMGWDQ